MDEQARTDYLAAVSGAGPEEAVVAMSRLMNVAAASFERRAQLEEALQSRIVIEQAKGILAERFGVGVDDAFAVLRRAARSHRVKLHELAARVIESRTTPPELAGGFDAMVKRDG